MAVKNLQSERSNVSATALLVKWQRPLVPILGYYVSYKAIKVPSVPLSNATLYELSLNDSSTMVQITGLESFTTYNITVTPIAGGNIGMKSRSIVAGMCYIGQS